MTRPAAVAAAAVMLAPACLDAQVSDAPGMTGVLLPPGSDVPSAHDDAAIERQIDQNDRVAGEVPLVHGFAGGQAIAYWDLGPAPDFAAPIFELVEEAPDGELRPIDHPTIVDAIPGDAGYSPFWAVLAVKVTDAYDGELLTSFAAVQEAERVGLVETPVLQRVAINCPVVARGTTLEVGGGEQPIAPAARFFWKGMSVDYYDFGPFALEDNADLPPRARYVLRREGGEPLSEVARGVDMTGDGDLNDTNDVFAERAGDDGFSPLCRTVDVVVAATTGSIDDSGDETVADIRAASDLFDPDVVEGTVVAVSETDELRNCPQQRQVGAL
jgi:hypothetical protein